VIVRSYCSLESKIQACFITYSTKTIKTLVGSDLSFIEETVNDLKQRFLKENGIDATKKEPHLALFWLKFY